MAMLTPPASLKPQTNQMATTAPLQKVSNVPNATMTGPHSATTAPMQTLATPPQAVSSFAPGVNLHSTNPQSDLRGQTITPGPMADRNAIAQTYENNWNNATAPQYQADLRSATSQAAGAGQLGSGQLRTSLGNLAYNRDVNRNAQEGNFLNSALQGSIGDAYNNIGIAQQQQGFQAGQQQQTFNQGLQSLLAGQSGNPADTQFALSQMYGGQAGQSQQGLAGLINNTVANNNQPQAPVAPQPTTQSNPFAPGNYGIGSGGLYNPSSWITGGK